MRCEAEFTYVAEEIGQLLSQLPDSPEKLHRIAGMIAAMSMIESELRQLNHESEQVENYYFSEPMALRAQAMLGSQE